MLLETNGTRIYIEGKQETGTTPGGNAKEGNAANGTPPHKGQNRTAPDSGATRPKGTAMKFSTPAHTVDQLNIIHANATTLADTFTVLAQRTAAAAASLRDHHPDQQADVITQLHRLSGGAHALAVEAATLSAHGDPATDAYYASLHELAMAALDLEMRAVHTAGGAAFSEQETELARHTDLARCIAAALSEASLAGRSDYVHRMAP